MKIVFLTAGGTSAPSSRYRVFNYADGLKEAGWRVEIIAPRHEEPSWRTALRALPAARNSDIVFIQKRLFPAFCVSILRRKADGNLIYDFDDALFAAPHPARGRSSQKRTVGRLNRSLAIAKIVIAGNSFLADYAADYNSSIRVLPTPIDISAHPRRPPHRQETPQIIGWVGTSSNFPYLKTACQYISELAKERPLRLQVVSDKEFHYNGLDVDSVPWDPEKEAVLLHHFDVGIMPLEDTTWARGKCAFKILQYMAVAVPVVCSPVGTNREVMRNGVHGFFAETPSEWRQSLLSLLDDLQLRERMGTAGRENVSENYSVKTLLPRLLRILADVAGHRE